MLYLILLAVAVYAGFHLGHGHASYRHARAAGYRRTPSLYIGARGPYVTIPGPFGTRIGHRL